MFDALVLKKIHSHNVEITSKRFNSADFQQPKKLPEGDQFPIEPAGSAVWFICWLGFYMSYVKDRPLSFLSGLFDGTLDVNVQLHIINRVRSIQGCRISEYLRELQHRSKERV
jgi:hypothetical protein